MISPATGWAFLFVLATLLLPFPEARADRIGGSSLPSPAPALKGRITEESGATFVAVVSTAVGTTTNAGPTFLETPSAFVDRGIGYAQVAQTLFGRVDFNVSVADRRYVAFTDADERSGQANLSWAREVNGQQTTVTLAASGARDIEERLTQASFAISHAWTAHRVKPYIQADVAVLDYHDMPGELLPFANQDDRDRISSRVQAGLRLTITDHLALEVGAGVDAKHYLEHYDDFGVRRDSVSPYPVVGLAYASDALSLRAVYMPFRRFFKEQLFEDTWKHGYAAEAEIKLSESLKAFASARHGFEETDFLIASAAYEQILVAGVVMTGELGSLSLAASETRRDYDGLELLELARLDRKREVALSGEMPLFDAVSLSSRISYMIFHSSLGQTVTTDAFTVSLGLTYAVMQ